MVFFNDPVPCPDPAARAVRMTVAMRERVSELMETWRRRGHVLGFGIGIAMGYATLGRIGFEGRFDYAAIGAVTNLSSRLCSEASSGQILISQRVYSAVHELVEGESMGDLTLRGFLKPVPVFNVVRLKDGAATAPPPS
jgi:adenylate cyclase